MTASVRTLGTFTIGLAALATIPATPLATPINASASRVMTLVRRERSWALEKRLPSVRSRHRMNLPAMTRI